MIAHYLFPLLFSGGTFVLLIWLRNQFKNRFWKSSWPYITLFVAIYFIIISSVLYKEFALNMKLDELDLNGDGIFSGEEITFEQKELMRRIAKDTARKYSLFIWIIFSGVLTFALFLFNLIRNSVLNRYIKKTKALDI